MMLGTTPRTCPHCGHHGHEAHDANGAWCQSCNKRTWPPQYDPGTSTAQAWRGSHVEAQRLAQYEEGIGIHAHEIEEIGR